MFSGILRHLVGAYVALLFLLILSTHHSCSARKSNNNYCTPSSCGHIHNISYPFRLDTDPKSCGHKNYELICENNIRPTLYLNRGKYYVEAIDYKNFTIRLVDVGVQKDDCSSVPQHTFNVYVSSLNYFYDNIYDSYLFGSDLFGSHLLIFLTCPNPIPNAPFDIVDASSCKNDSTASYNSTFNISSPNSHNTKGYSYVAIFYDHPTFAVLPNLCRIDLVYRVPASIEQKIITNISYRNIHDMLVYGFELSWFSTCCSFYKESRCDYFDEATMNADCELYRIAGGPIKIALEFVASNILDYGFAFVLVIPNYLARKSAGFLKDPSRIRKHLPVDYSVYYDRRGGKSQLTLTIGDGYRWRNWTITSDLLSIIAVLLHALLLLLPLNLMYRALLFLCGLPCLIALLIYKWRRRHLSMYDNIEEFLQSDDHNLMPIRYSYSKIKKITNGFKEKLGEGGFGSVYKGKLRSGRFAAIKFLEKSKANGQDFINEVSTIGRIHHVNVVQLIGFTVEGTNRALIYEFMPNGSLEKYIFSKQGNIPLSNEKIYEISLGVARGIEYLHHGCDMQILHFDIKPHNILLDEKFVPKISDFGLAKLYPAKNNIVSITAARGTIGYMAPELFYKNIGGVSYKADVYSFGMLLMEMVGRRKNLNAIEDHSSRIYFPSWVYDQVSEGKNVESGNHATEQEKETIRKMMIVALWCIQLKPNDRPSMHKVVQMLEADVDSLQMPPKPFLTPQNMPTNDDKASPIRLSDPPNDCIDPSYQFGR